MKNKKSGFIFSIVLLIVGMTIGFALLSRVYDGPKWVSFVVFIVYLFILFFTVKASRGYLQAIEELERKNSDAKEK